MLIQIELTVIAGDHESYNISVGNELIVTGIALSWHKNEWRCQISGISLTSKNKRHSRCYKFHLLQYQDTKDFQHRRHFSIVR
jgi:hypothetical protein